MITSGSPIAFVTGNPGKFATAREHLGARGVQVEQVSLELDEIQTTQVGEVSRYKAEQAFRALRSPLIVQDSGFGFDELGGWPGPMVRQLVEAVGPHGVAHIADLTSTRRCAFVSSLVYVDAAGRPHEYEDSGSPGTVATAAVPNVAEAWSPLWQVFVPEGASMPLAALGGQERRRILDDWRERSAFTRFARTLAGSGQVSAGTAGVTGRRGR